MDDLAIDYPYLARFCNEESVDIVSYTRTHQSLILKDIVADSIPMKLRRSYDARKSILNQYLELAYRHNILDLDRRSRLKGKDSIRFWSLINELKAAAWFEGQGLVIDFDPSSLGGGKGEFEAFSRQGEVFVEVKTLFGDKEMLGQYSLLSRLADYLEKIGLPISTIELISYPRNFCEDDLDKLLTRIGLHLLRFVPAIKRGESKVSRYNSRKGLVIEFELLPGTSEVEQIAYGGFIDIEDSLKSKLGMSVRGWDPKLQLSTKDIPSIVIICDQGSWSDPIIEGILYGNRLGTLGSTGTVWYERKRDGRWDNTYPSRLSAVGIFKSSLDIFPSSVDMYLCPNPLYPLPRSLMSDTNIRWWQLGKDKVSITEVSA